MTPDFVEGTAFGDALGVGLRCLSTSWWTVTALSPSPQLREAVRIQRTCDCGMHHLSLSCSRESNFPCSQMFDSLLDRRMFFRFEFHNPRHLTGMHSRSTYMPPLAPPRLLFQSECPFLSLVTGQTQVLWPLEQPTSLRTQYLSNSSYSLRQIQMPLLRR